MNFVTARRALLSGAALAAALGASSAYAQDAAPSASGTEEAEVGDVVVTAQRREERLVDVPVSVAVVRGQQLRDFQAAGDDTLALAGRVPGLYAETTTGRIFPRFYIRGLGNIDFYLGASQPVSIIQDDVVLEHVVLKSNPVYDLDRVEVLRGPQGSLFGRNTTAGIIKFDTIRPSDTFEGRASASVGSYASTNLDAGFGGPIVDDLLSFRVSGLYQHRDGWVDNSYTGPSFDGTRGGFNALGGFDDRNLRLQLRLTPSDALTVDLSGHGRWYEGTSTIFHRGALIRGSNSVENAPRDRVALDEAMNNPQAYDTYGASARVSYDFGGAVLTSISAWETTEGYSRGDTDGGAATAFAGPAYYGESQGNIRDLDQFSQELRLASPGTGRFNWQVGGYYFDSRDITDFYQRRYFLTTPFNANNPNSNNPNNWVRLRNTNTSWAGFGQLSYELTDGFTITGGARITNDTKRTRLLKTADGGTGQVTYTGRRDVELDDTRESWDLSALYKLSQDVSVYARVASGFRGPTIQGRSAVFNSDFTTADSETILSWEAGIKGSALDNRVRFNLNGFYYTVDNIQLNANDVNGNGVLLNADKAQAYGVEAELDVRPIDNLALSLGGSWLHTEIKDSAALAQVCVLGGAVVCTVTDPTVTIPGRGVFASIDGNRLPNAPEYNFNVAARYDIPVQDDGKFFVSSDWNVQGFTNFVLYDTKEFNSKGNFEGGLKIGYEGGNGDWEIAAFARNITNEKNLKGVLENYMAAVFNDPRIIGVSFNGRLR
ncbi:TonB-dependent receptor [Sphingomonas sp. S2-65]|uniref:TonB-dependent receptor n=1 Tax=Sphingomonas sp. S2-65 TaxID=2903960 RepID=UPI001F33864D|nr:TonB-dependent receptor [Sphingomonas sp. S2-65]UYY59060.1 TonB-dependent receptor [Sphingomonas sp. S2-65]